MMLVYNLPATDAIYQRFAGLEGSAYVIGGFGMTALGSGKIIVVPIRSVAIPANDHSSQPDNISRRATSIAGNLSFPFLRD
jgi:hypothetical protein